MDILKFQQNMTNVLFEELHVGLWIIIPNFENFLNLSDPNK